MQNKKNESTFPSWYLYYLFEQMKQKKRILDLISLSQCQMQYNLKKFTLHNIIFFVWVIFWRLTLVKWFIHVHFTWG